MRFRYVIPCLVLFSSASASMAEEALCNQVKDRLKRDQCHCQAESGATVEKTPSGGIRWSNVPNRLAPVTAECMRKRGHST